MSIKLMHAVTSLSEQWPEFAHFRLLPQFVHFSKHFHILLSRSVMWSNPWKGSRSKRSRPIFQSGLRFCGIIALKIYYSAIVVSNSSLFWIAGQVYHADAPHLPGFGFVEPDQKPPVIGSFHPIFGRKPDAGPLNMRLVF